MVSCKTVARVMQAVDNTVTFKEHRATRISCKELLLSTHIHISRLCHTEKMRAGYGKYYASISTFHGRPGSPMCLEVKD